MPEVGVTYQAAWGCKEAFILGNFSFYFYSYRVYGCLWSFSCYAKYDLLYRKSNKYKRPKCLFNQYELLLCGILEIELLIAFKSDLELSNTGLYICEGWDGSWQKDTSLMCTGCINAKITQKSQPFNEGLHCFLLMEWILVFFLVIFQHCWLSAIQGIWTLPDSSLCGCKTGNAKWFWPKYKNANSYRVRSMGWPQLFLYCFRLGVESWAASVCVNFDLAVHFWS